MRYLLTVCTGLVVLGIIHPARGAISASSNNSQPITSSNYSVVGPPMTPTVTITEDVVLSPTNGPWHKNLINNTGGGIASGNNVQILETLTNTGSASWTDWHERVFSRTTINTPNDNPGFLFRQNTLSVQGDYGSGFVPLTLGPDYTISVIPYSGPADPGGNGQGWEEINIFLAPARTILNGNRLRISKQIFEVFLDGNIWMQGEAAEIEQFPTPEPGSIGLIAAAGVMLIRRRAKAL